MTKRFNSKVLRFWQRIPLPRRAILLIAVVALICLCAGFIAGRATAPDKTPPPLSPIASQQLHGSKARTTNGYERALEMVNQDLETKRITKDQATVLRNKLAEVYAYRKTVASTPKAREELRAKRADWQKWAQQNHLSSRYFIPLY